MWRLEKVQRAQDKSTMLIIRRLPFNASMGSFGFSKVVSVLAANCMPDVLGLIVSDPQVLYCFG